MEHFKYSMITILYENEEKDDFEQNFVHKRVLLSHNWKRYLEKVITDCIVLYENNKEVEDYVKLNYPNIEVLIGEPYKVLNPKVTIFYYSKEDNIIYKDYKSYYYCDGDKVRYKPLRYVVSEAINILNDDISKYEKLLVESKNRKEEFMSKLNRKGE